MSPSALSGIISEKSLGSKILGWCSYLANSSCIIYVTKDGKIDMWDVEIGLVSHKCSLSHDLATCALNADGSYFRTVTTRGEIKVWDLQEAPFSHFCVMFGPKDALSPLPGLQSNRKPVTSRYGDLIL